MRERTRRRTSSAGAGRAAAWLSTAAIAFLVAVGLDGAQVPPAADTGRQEDELVELFGEISRNMGLIEEMLKKRESGPSCQGSQQELVEQIDELVEELKKRQCSGSGGGGGQSQKPQSSAEEQKDQQAQEKQEAGERREGRKPQQGAAKEQGEREKQGKAPNVRRGDEKPPPAGVGGPLTEKQGGAGWGFLPGEVRALLDASGRNGVPPKYAEVIRRYFERLSEQKGEE